MKNEQILWVSLTLVVAILGALVYLYIVGDLSLVGLRSPYVRDIAENYGYGQVRDVGTFALVLSLIVFLLFSYGLCMEKRFVWVIVLSLIVVLLCGLGLLLYLYGWLDGNNKIDPLCICDFSPDCTRFIAECRATHEAMATQLAPPTWWPLHR